MQQLQQQRGNSGHRGSGMGSARVLVAVRRRSWRWRLQHSCGGQQGGRAAAAVAARQQQWQRGNGGGSTIAAVAVAAAVAAWRWRPAWQLGGSMAAAWQ
jgi:hypothetical protein